MAKLTLNDIASGYGSSAKINSNNDLIEAAVENTLSLDGTTPNAMQADLDMNGNELLNLAAPTSDNSAARWIDVASAGSLDVTVPTQTGNDGKYLKTTGSTLAWDTPGTGDYLPLTGGTVTGETIWSISSVVKMKVGSYGVLFSDAVDDAGDWAAQFGVGGIRLDSEEFGTVELQVYGDPGVEVYQYAMFVSPTSGTRSQLAIYVGDGIEEALLVKSDSAGTAYSVETGGPIELQHATDTTVSRLAAGQVGVEGKAVLQHDGSYTSGKVTFSTSDASGGSSGDIWYKYTA